MGLFKWQLMLLLQKPNRMIDKFLALKFKTIKYNNVTETCLTDLRCFCFVCVFRFCFVCFVVVNVVVASVFFFLVCLN